MTIRYKPCCGEVETLLDNPEFKVLFRQLRPENHPRGEDYPVWDLVESVDICSSSCLVEYAWKLKESQPKLSKSKMTEEQAADDEYFRSGTRYPGQ